MLTTPRIWVRSAVRFSRAIVCASSGTESVRKAMATCSRQWAALERTAQFCPHRILNLVEQPPHRQRVARRGDFDFRVEKAVEDDGIIEPVQILQLENHFVDGSKRVRIESISVQSENRGLASLLSKSGERE